MSVPFSPALVAGLALPPLATPVIARTAQALATRLWQRHRRSFDRLGDYLGTRFLIKPEDLPFAFVMEMREEGPLLETYTDKDEPPETDAVIRGSIRALLDMAEGRVDGDALFFTRDLSIEGDTEAVVALRNAIDDADIDFVEEIAESFGPLSKPVASLGNYSRKIAGRIVEDFDTLQDAVIRPLMRRQSIQEDRIEALERQVQELETKLRKQSSRLRAQEKKIKDAKA